MAKGKYQEWLTPDGLLLLEGWARDGLTDEQIAHNIGIAERTFTEWKSRFDAISAALKKGKAPVDLQVENELLKRALGFEYTETRTEKIGNRVTKTVTITKMVVPDVTAQIFWLKNRRRDKWKDRPEIDSVSAESTELLNSINEILTRRCGDD